MKSAIHTTNSPSMEMALKMLETVQVFEKSQKCTIIEPSKNDLKNV